MRSEELVLETEDDTPRKLKSLRIIRSNRVPPKKKKKYIGLNSIALLSFTSMSRRSMIKYAEINSLTPPFPTYMEYFVKILVEI